MVIWGGRTLRDFVQVLGYHTAGVKSRARRGKSARATLTDGASDWSIPGACHLNTDKQRGVETIITSSKMA
jgi:hypothetical protein